MVPLNLILKYSLIHKIKKYKAFVVTHCREVPQSLLQRKTGASLTVEAALVFPLILFAFCGILFFFRVLHTSLDTKGALAAAASRLALELTGEKEAGARGLLYFGQELKEKGASTQWIAGGITGIRWLGTQTSGEDVILCIQYDCRLPVALFGIRKIPVSQQVKIRKWIGAGQGAPGDGGEENWVYITPSGSVYHTSRECTHLQLSVRTASETQAKAEYTPCQRCGSKLSGLCYYVTDEGERYHTTLRCSGLKRTVYLVRLSEAAGYGGCSRCVGK